jgi:hypothetical protein
MPTYMEVVEQLSIVLNHGRKQDAIDKLQKWAKEANINDAVFCATASEKLNVKNEQEPQQRSGARVKDRFKKHSPKEWIDLMKNSPWAKGGFQGITNRGDAQDVIDGTDGIAGFPSYIECSWDELENAPGNRPGFLIKMIVAFENFNEKYAYMKR